MRVNSRSHRNDLFMDEKKMDRKKVHNLWIHHFPMNTQFPPPLHSCSISAQHASSASGDTYFVWYVCDAGIFSLQLAINTHSKYKTCRIVKVVRGITHAQALEYAGKATIISLTITTIQSRRHHGQPPNVRNAQSNE